MEPEKVKSHREQAEELIAQINPESADGPYKSAVGHALLAIHEELSAIRLKDEPPPTKPRAFGASTFST